MVFRAALLLTLAGLDARAAPAFDELDAFVEAQQASHAIPGVALAIIQGGQTVHTRGFGVDPNAPFLLGSLSKSFTAVAVLQQVEAGRLQLDAPVRRYLPWFALADETAAAALTVRQLLHHQSGLPAGTTGPKNEGFTLEEHVRALKAVAPREAVGTRHRYSSSNYLVLGLLVEKVSNQTFAAYVQKHIFEPLQMTNSFTSMAQAKAHGLTPGHRLWAGFPLSVELAEEPGRLPTAALISSAPDLAIFLSALMGAHPAANVLLTPRSRALLQEPGAPAENFSYAMGWRVGPTAEVPSLWHGGALPNYRGAMVFSPAEQWGVVVLSNLGSHAVDHTRAIAKGVTARLAGKPPPPAEQPLRWISRLLAAVVALPIGLALWKLARVRRWKPKGSRQKLVRTQGLAVAASVLTAVALAPLLGLPLWALFEAAPDLVLEVGLLLALNTLLALLRLRLVLALPAEPRLRAL